MEKGLSVSTLRVQIAALSLFTERRLAEDPLVKRFLSARSRHAPRVIKHVPPWDLSLVLNALTRAPFEPLHEAYLKIISLKLSFLLAISSGRRISGLKSLSCKDPFLRTLEDRVMITPDPFYLPKVSSNFHRSQEIVLPSFCTSPKNAEEKRFVLLDVKKCLLLYLEKTSGFRSSSQLLVLFSGPKKGSKASKSSIARWIRGDICKAYKVSGRTPPSRIRAHSMRSMATSWAERAGASWEEISKAAVWSSSHAFVKHYRVQMLSSQDLSFGRKVLQAVVPP